MIYPCPYCDTELNLQPEHLGRLITCPACGKSFVADDIPPVTVVEKSNYTKSNRLAINLAILFLLILLFFYLYHEIEKYSYTPMQKQAKSDAVEVIEVLE
jgi:uncharacterized protein YbaR (Trm112 family)